MADAIFTQCCSLCKIEQPLSNFHRRESGRYRKDCKQCHAQRMKEVYQRSRERYIKAAGDYKKRNAQKTLEANRAWRAANRDRDSEVKAEWRKRNPHMVVAAVQRRNASKLKATPAWASEEAIRLIYLEAQRRTAETGIKWQVDHIVPLRSDFVCGLHCEVNLRVITAEENNLKRNAWWPDMPECFVPLGWINEKYEELEAA